MTGDLEVGTEVARIAPGFTFDGQPGSVIEVTDDRIRVMWRLKGGADDKRTWQQRRAEGKRWRRKEVSHG